MRSSLYLFLLMALFTGTAFAQQPRPKQGVRTVTVPISIFTKAELREGQAGEYVRAERLIVQEDKDVQEILSIRSVSTTPLSIAIVIQEDLTSNFNLQIKDIQGFIRNLPKGTRVMVAYMRSGGIDVRQRFTDDLERAAKSLRIVSGNSAFGPRSPFDGLNEVLGRFDAVPSGRRAVLLFSDGLDTTHGADPVSVAQSFELDRSILKAQRKSVAVYSFYAPTRLSDNGSILSSGGQGALDRLAEETGGRSFGSGSIAPVSYMPYFRDMVLALDRQFALTYLSTHMKKGYHKVSVQSTNPEVKVEHPAGYYYR